MIWSWVIWPMQQISCINIFDDVVFNCKFSVVRNICRLKKHNFCFYSLKSGYRDNDLPLLLRRHLWYLQIPLFKIPVSLRRKVAAAALQSLGDACPYLCLPLLNVCSASVNICSASVNIRSPSVNIDAVTVPADC